MKIVAKLLSDKYDHIYTIAEKEGTLDDFKKIPEVDNFNGLVIDLCDEHGVVDVVKVDAKTIEQVFNIVVKTEDELHQSYTPEKSSS